MAMEHSSYKSLAANCDSITIEELAPGDLVITHDQKSKNGRVFLVLNMIENTKGNRLYALATGCSNACDFHIPLFNMERNNPWIDGDKINKILTEYPLSGLLRWKIKD